MGVELSLPRRALSVEDYHRMGEAGLFGPDERIELIQGDLVTMAPIGGPHLHAVSVLAELLTLRVGRSAFISVQNPISLPPDNEPQPDITLLRPEFRQRNDVPSAGDVLLAIEVADTTLARDQRVKMPLYARHGIPESWLFDLVGEQATVYRDPSPEGYRTLISLARDATVSPLCKPEVEIVLAEIWPAKRSNSL